MPSAPPPGVDLPPDPAAVPGAAAPEPPRATPGGVLSGSRGSFEVHLDVFSGPFELLLGLIAKHKLDVTEISLAAVTDEFVAHLRAAQEARADWDLSQASEFVLIAATLLDLKAARLLPNAREDDEEDLALIEARDLLFARLLQYRAFKQVADELRLRMEGAGRIFARDVGVEDRFASLLPELVLTVTPEQLAMIAGRAMIPKPPPTVGLTHLHAPQVSVREQASLLVGRLRDLGSASFRDLVADADSTLMIVARFLALLELFRDTVVQLDQAEALGELTVRWTGPASGAVGVSAEFDEEDAQSAVPPGAGHAIPEKEENGADE
ncbi:segregation and condensation protein A [Ornithinimicrobium tianjinense]|uniref:Segregation and condensation protein A n=1 Tax=Ornithinimicrobium tianjinense TaxID=1195761 RepID=A0A917BKM7_9MICO|nr:ScpA family protein [Ornithinimicrobium tianjinense]GGF46978.1 segregation/condensation protein A [Ornithinimicrobium tianjinense]